MPEIVYLDQSILSNLVKHRQGRIRDADASRIYDQLDKAIQQCIGKGCHVFPESSDHRYEATLDFRIDEDEWRYLKDMSHGLEFIDSSQIIDTQIRCALDQWLHDNQRERAWWEGVFNQDPHEQYAPSPYQVFVRFPYSSEFIKRQRLDSNRIPTLLAPLVPITSKRTLQEQTELELTWLISHLFIPREIDFSASLYEQFAQTVDYKKAENHLQYLTRRGLSEANILSFLQSRELAQTPIINIRAKLWGHLMVNSARRRPRRSDPADIDIMATTLPYCDIVTTDSYMRKVVVEDLKLADSYDTLVLSAKLNDVTELTSRLS